MEAAKVSTRVMACVLAGLTIAVILSAWPRSLSAVDPLLRWLQTGYRLYAIGGVSLCLLIGGLVAIYFRGRNEA
jgi:hypothetical protein